MALGSFEATASSNAAFNFVASLPAVLKIEATSHGNATCSFAALLRAVSKIAASANSNAARSSDAVLQANASKPPAVMQQKCRMYNAEFRKDAGVLELDRMA